ncbi:hypothetical protein DH2020_029328 [Rehmannia glutinosa]|uniref:Uncharacterized protein n=1 Tax=Rehmannia glutinosa TaxID=99300 RepID=A0ABR0VNU4_REHGL
MDLGCIDMGCVEKPRKETSLEKDNSPNESSMSASKLGKNNKAKDAVRSSLNALNKLTSQISKPSHRKTSPLNWFPRKKVEPYLKRKIKMLQEVDGMHSTLDETLGDSNPHYCRVLREKIAIKEAAEKAMEARKAAMVEASWCRILQAARIESKEAEAQLSKAELSAAEAFEAARNVGVIMNDIPDSQNHFKIETSSAKGGSETHTVSATFETAFEVDKQVAGAVKAAFIKLANCPSINKEEFKELLRKISENPDTDENHNDTSDFASECESDLETGKDSSNNQDENKKGQECDKFSTSNIVDMMLGRLRCLKEDELASLATIVATSGLNAALAETGNESPCLKVVPRRMSQTRGTAGDELPSLDKFLVKRLTRLEREVLEAKNARKNEAIDDNKSSAEVMPEDGTIIPDLGSVLVKRSSKLEKEVEEARMKRKSFEMENKKIQRAGRIGAVGRVKQDVEEVPSLDKFLVKRLTRLEREVLEARNGKQIEPIEGGNVIDSIKTTTSIADAANSEETPFSSNGDSKGKENLDLNKIDNRSIGSNFSHRSKDGGNADANYESLDKVLVKHVSRLEKEKQDFCADEQTRTKMKRKDASRELESGEGSLDQVLVKHVSRLEKEKMDFCVDEQTRTKMKRKDASRELESGEGSLDQVLVKHVSRLEKEKLEFCADEQTRTKMKRKDASRELESGEGSLDQVLVKHKSRLEREKIGANVEQQEDDVSTRHSVCRRQAREKELQAAWGGLSLGNSMRPHISNLMLLKASWKTVKGRSRQRSNN